MKQKQIFHSRSIANTWAIAGECLESLSKRYKKNIPPLCLFGTLGSGKTIFVKGIAKYLGWNPKKIKSPTFTFIRVYKKGKNRLLHFDFYRAEKPDQFLKESLLEYLKEKHAVIIVEWADRVKKLLPKRRTDIYFKHRKENHRDIIIINRDEKTS